MILSRQQFLSCERKVRQVGPLINNNELVFNITTAIAFQIEETSFCFVNCHLTGVLD